MWKPISSVPGGGQLSAAIREAFPNGPGERLQAAVDALTAGSFAPDDHPFEAEIRARTLPNTMLFRARLSPNVQRWNMRASSRHTHLGIVLAGSIEVATDTGEAVVHRAGDVYLFPRWRWVRTAVREGVELIHIAVLTERLNRRGVDTDPDRLGIAWRPRLAELLHAIAVAVADAPASDPYVDRVADDALEDVIVGVLLESPDSRSGTQPHSALRARALRLIETTHTDAGLHPAVIAGELGVSLRQLQRAFEAAGLSVATALRERRILTATELLAAPRHSSRTVADIARASGFPSAAALRTALRRRGDLPPGELRRTETTAAEPIAF